MTPSLLTPLKPLLLLRGGTTVSERRSCGCAIEAGGKGHMVELIPYGMKFFSLRRVLEEVFIPSSIIIHETVFQYTFILYDVRRSTIVLFLLMVLIYRDTLLQHPIYTIFFFILNLSQLLVVVKSIKNRFYNPLRDDSRGVKFPLSVLTSLLKDRPALEV